MEQLKRAFGHVSQADTRRTVILAGDLNIRDKEVASVGLPDKVQVETIREVARWGLAA